MRARPSAPNRILAHALLALAFLFAQHVASLHWLGHAVETIEATDADPVKAPAHAADHCDGCLLLSALGALAPGSEFKVDAISVPPVWRAALPPASSPVALRLAFRSRAPPILL